MIKNEEIELLKLKEARIDFLESDSTESPIRRPMVRIAEVAQTFTAWDLYKAQAELERDIKNSEINLTPKVFKMKVQNLKDTLIDGIRDLKRSKELIDDEIKIIESTLDITKLESDFQAEAHKKAVEESNK